MDRSTIKTFNSAKKYAEEILHPLMIKHNEAKIRTRLGEISDDEAIKVSPKKRVIRRFNAMKERIILQQSLVNEIEATVRLNGVKSEIELLEEINNQLSLLEEAYDSREDELIEFNDEEMPRLTQMFKEMGSYLDKTYVQIQRMMTKNKLLFFGEDNEFLENEELMERIKNENRRA